MITIWGGASSRSMRAHWMAHELDLVYDAKLVGSRTGETQTAAFRLLNPKEKIPVLVDDKLVLTESAAIVTAFLVKFRRSQPAQSNVSEPSELVTMPSVVTIFL